MAHTEEEMLIVEEKKLLDISQLSSQYKVRFMSDEDAEDILEFCKENTQYYQYCGKQPSLELIQSDLHITPPGIEASSKYYIGFYENNLLVALMDLIDGYPSEDCSYIGFFMMNKNLQGNHIGTNIIQEVCRCLKAEGYTSVMLGIDKGNPQSTHFWKKNGFHVIREVKQDEGTILVAEKKLMETYSCKENMVEFRKVQNLPAWECMMKKLVWKQIGEMQGKKILDFGSGVGITACHYAKDNELIAIEPDEESVNTRWTDNPYTQLLGSLDKLKEIADESIDFIICHNVLEYAGEREKIVCEFSRILKPDGKISLVKHNRPGRVMQMVVLLDNFEQAHSLLDGNNSTASKYGAICYYEDSEIEKWAPSLKITRTLGMRTFWDLQQKQEHHGDLNWQDKMLEVELRVSDMEEYKSIAFFHHLTIEKSK